ncbi:MAG: phosphatase PAP2 family protein [Sphaerochaetaceae bacterium]|nr:phosphatase PAP2 family protein [Sphaerochaetaceae bacterium]
MNIQHSIMIFFNSIFNPVADTVFSFISYLGLGTMHLVFILLIFWCMDKKKGFLIGFTLVFANATTNIIKALVRSPRPWQVLSEIGTQRDANATGYSFPSGHTTGVTATFGSIAYVYKKRGLSIICALIIALVGFSRLYLCVHWPIDVAGGLLVGSFFVFVVMNPVMKMLENRSLTTKVLLALGTAGSVAALVTGLMLNSGKYEEILLSDLSKSLAIVGGFSLGYVLEMHTSDFQIEEGCWGRKTARYVLGFLGVLFFLPVAKTLLLKAGYYNPVTAQLRYFLAGLWCLGIWPVLGKKLKLFV